MTISEEGLAAIHFDTMSGPILRKMDSIREELKAMGDDDLEITCHISNGMLLDHLKQLYASLGASLVVIGLTGNESVRHIFLGSNTLAIVNGLGHPVLTVPPQARFGVEKKIVFACNMLHVADNVPAAKIKRVVELLGTELLVLHVQQGSQSAGELLKERQALDKLLEGTDYSFHTLSHPNFIAGIKDFSREHAAGLILMIPKKHDFLESLLRINHTRIMLMRSSIPILTVPV